MVLDGFSWTQQYCLCSFVFLQRRLFSKILVFDLICLVTIMLVVSVNTFLGAGLNLSSPCLNAIKYDYQSLPFFSLLAASLASKCLSLFPLAKSRRRLNKLLFYVAFVGMVLLIASFFGNMYYAHRLSTSDFLLFRVEGNRNIGYSLFNSSTIGKNSFLIDVQYLGFAFVLSGLLWVSRDELKRLRKLSLH